MGNDDNHRDRFESWCDKHNHTMAAMRTVTSALAAIFSAAVALKVFGLI
tara:strand:+ start:686 stop:832 length:147 start_codon:yes stop_codon:yes gene_type:complete